MVGGLDEVGRGALAGPVAAGLVVFPRDVDESLLLEVTDSKKLSQKSRERLSHVIRTQSLVCEVGYADAIEIDQLGIVPATKLAMYRAIDKSVLKLDYLIVDALDMSETGIPFYSLYKADQISKTVAAASIIAKVHRDHYLIQLSPCLVLNVNRTPLKRKYPKYLLSWSLVVQEVILTILMLQTLARK